MHNRSLPNLLWYRFVQILCRVTFFLYFRLRVEGARNVPRDGGCIMLANHQSHLDPLIAGVACPRPLHPMARESLFRVPGLGWLIRILGAIPIDRDGFGIAGIKATLKALKAGDVVLVFGEGTRSPDGHLQPFKLGFCTLARRTKVPIVPLAISGAYDAFPRSSKFPRPAKIHARIGLPILPEEYAAMSDEELLAVAESRIRECFAGA